jgi:hypothetical protein|nr:MAG TPA: hypothetical protein [Bacteriophage sp.]
MSVKYQIIESLMNRDSMIHEDMSSINKANNKIIYSEYTDDEFTLKATKREYSELNSSVMIDKYIIISFVGDDKVAVVDLHYKNIYSYYCIGFMYTLNSNLNKQYLNNIKDMFHRGNIQDIRDFRSLIIDSSYSFYSHVGFNSKSKKFVDIPKVINNVELESKTVSEVRDELAKSNLRENKDYKFTYCVFTDINSDRVYIENTIEFISDNEENSDVYDTLCDVLRDCENTGKCSMLLRLKNKIMFSLYINGGN